MLPARLGPRRTLFLAWAVVCLFAGVAHAGGKPVVARADIDGDGRPDRIVFDRSSPSIIRVWLSKTGTTSIVRSARPLLHVIVRDIDGDHRAEVIASDQRAHLHVWTDSHQNQGLRKVHARRFVPSRLGHPARGAIDNGPTDDPSTIADGSPPSLRLTLRSPSPAPSQIRDPRPALAITWASGAVIAAFGPRPPPTRTL